MHLAASQEVEVQIGDCLLALRALVDDEAEAVFAQAQLPSHLTSCHQQVSKHLRVSGRNILVHRSHRQCLWDEENVCGRHRSHIMKGQHCVRLQDYGGGTAVSARKASKHTVGIHTTTRHHTTGTLFGAQKAHSTPH